MADPLADAIQEGRRRRRAAGREADLHIYTLITPEGREVVTGFHETDEQARQAVEDEMPEDWLSLCCYPLRQRRRLPGEQIEKGDRWTRELRERGA